MKQVYEIFMRARHVTSSYIYIFGYPEGKCRRHTADCDAGIYLLLNTLLRAYKQILFHMISSIEKGLFRNFPLQIWELTPPLQRVTLFISVRKSFPSPSGYLITVVEYIMGYHIWVGQYVNHVAPLYFGI